MRYIGELRAWQSARYCSLLKRSLVRHEPRCAWGDIELGIMSHRNLLVEDRAPPAGHCQALTSASCAAPRVNRLRSMR